MTNLVQLSASQLRHLLDSRECSAREITEAFLTEIDKKNRQINCYLNVDHQKAIQQADEADQRIFAANRTDQGISPVSGIPIAMKDIFERDGEIVSAGSKPYRFQSTTTATTVSRLNQSGAVVLGTLNLDEFAAGGTGANAHFGHCNNPWNENHITGGSSSGSAAAVSARMTPVSIGSDAGGSIRLPAAYCGVTGIKPTYGRVSRYGAVPRTWSMDCIGPIAHSAEDCALLLDVIAGVDQYDSTTIDAKKAFWPLSQPDLSGIRIGVDPLLLSETDSETSNAIEKTLGVLQQVGAATLQIALERIDTLNDMQQIVVKSEGASYHGQKLKHHSSSVSKETKSVIQEGFLIPATSYIQALSLRASLLDQFINTAFKGCDAILIPVSPSTAPKRIPDSKTLAHQIEKDFTTSARFTRFANYLGLPAIAFPIGIDSNGLPLSAQILAKPWAEKLILEIVDVFQKSAGMTGGLSREEKLTNSK